MEDDVTSTLTKGQQSLHSGNEAENLTEEQLREEKQWVQCIMIDSNIKHIYILSKMVIQYLD